MPQMWVEDVLSSVDDTKWLCLLGKPKRMTSSLLIPRSLVGFKVLNIFDTSTMSSCSFDALPVELLYSLLKKKSARHMPEIFC